MASVFEVSTVCIQLIKLSFPCLAFVSFLAMTRASTSRRCRCQERRCHICPLHLTTLTVPGKAPWEDAMPSITRTCRGHERHQKRGETRLHKTAFLFWAL